MTKLSPEMVEAIETYGEAGKSGTWISAKLELPAATVNYRMLRAGYDPWPGKRNSTLNQPGAFSPEEDAQMLRLGQEGMAPHRIAIAMKRPKTSVLIRLMTLEVRAEKALEKAA